MPSTPGDAFFAVCSNAHFKSGKSIRWWIDTNDRSEASMANSAICANPVETVSGFSVPMVVPCHSSLTRTPLSSTGSRRGLFADFYGNIRVSDSLAFIPPHFVSFAWRYQICSCRDCFRVRAGYATLGHYYRVPWPGYFWKGQGLPSSWATICAHAPLIDPGGITAPSQYGAGDVVFRKTKTVDSHNVYISGLNHAAYTLAVYASQDG
jgi:hypothetical protein